jgi:hypothetical protein
MLRILVSDAMHTKETLTPLLLETFRRAKGQLPQEIASRLTSSDHVRNHGNYSTMFLFNVWDVHQADILHRDHFCYCFGYLGSDVLKDRKNEGKPWYLHLWINTIRLYRSLAEIRELLEIDVKKACPKGFTYRATERFVEAKINFEFERAITELPDFLVPLYIRLIGAIHPVLLPIIDSFTEPLTKEERRAAILGRKRKYYGPESHPSRERIREYTRSIPKTWRAAILERFDHQCVFCKTPLTVSTAHMDHILPFSKGGATTLDNLQPLCAPCNLAKGNREVL